MSSTVLIWGRPQQYHNYTRAVEHAGGTVLYTSTVLHTPACDALFLPGGGDLEPWRYGRPNTASRGLEPERDTAELALLEQFATAGKPVLGVCRGLQVINVFFGGTLIQDLPGHSAMGGIDRLHFARAVPSPLGALCGRSMIVNSAHHQAVERLGTNLLAVQWAPDGTVEALCHRTLPVWAVQWHPERLWPSDDGVRLFQAFLSLCQ